jgi:hypothetical protein
MPKSSSLMPDLGRMQALLEMRSGCFWSADSNWRITLNPAAGEPRVS